MDCLKLYFLIGYNIITAIKATTKIKTNKLLTYQIHLKHLLIAIFYFFYLESFIHLSNESILA